MPSKLRQMFSRLPPSTELLPVRLAGEVIHEQPGAWAAPARRALGTNFDQFVPAFDSVAENESDDELPAVELRGWTASTRHRLLTPELAGEIRGLLPTRAQLYGSWTLVYGLEQHGMLLGSLYDRCLEVIRGPRHTTGGYHEGFMAGEVSRATGSGSSSNNRRVGCVLVIKDHTGGVFGAYVSEPFHPVDSKRFYGNGECFLWKAGVSTVKRLEGGEAGQPHLLFKAFPYTGVNDFLIYSTPGYLAMGLGGDRQGEGSQFGLWIDQEIEHGYSHRCDTFGNEGLSDAGDKFRVLGLEVWRVG